MTFLWRNENHNWGGAAGVRDSIAIQQSYPSVPGIREVYYYALGWGLIRWEYHHDGQPQDHMFANFNLPSAQAPSPCASQCTPATPGVEECRCAPTCDRSKICGVSSDGCGGTCRPGSGCQNGLAAGQSLRRGSRCIRSVGGNARLCHQDDGNVVVYTGAATPVWHTSTFGRATSDLTMQGDGNLVLYNRGFPLWNSMSGGRQNGAYVAVIQDDCNLVIYDGQGAHVWNSGRLCR